MRSAALLLLFLAVPVVAEVSRAIVVDGISERVPSQTVAPEYPRKARRDRVEGEVTVCFHVDRAGRPRRIAVRHSSDRQFEKPSLRAVRASRFEALRSDEQLPQIKTCRTFVFRLVPLDADGGQG